MNRKIFVNLPVTDLARSKQFFAKLGFGFDPRFTNEDAACMIVTDDIFVMLLTEKYFKTFTKKVIADAHRSTEVLVCLSEASREAVDAHLAKALEAGASEAREPQDLGFMYGRSFCDLDGHIWESVWVDEAAVQG